MDPVLELLSDLVAINSVNPSLVPGGAGEAAIADRVMTALRAAGLDVEVTDVAPGRRNVVGVLQARRSGRSLMFCGHLDTVGVEGMTEPFNPVMRDGRLAGELQNRPGLTQEDVMSLAMGAGDVQPVHE